MSADNKAVVRRLYEEVWNKRRLELVDEIISPSHALHDPNLTDSSVGPDAYKRKSRASSSAFLICASRLKTSLTKRKSWRSLGQFPALTPANSWEFPPQTRKCT